MNGPHRYAAGFGGVCDICSKQQHVAEHFGGDPVAAAEAYHIAKQRTESRERFRSGLQTGVRVRVTDDHPRDELAGRDGVVLSVESSNKTAEVLIEATGELQRTQLHLPIRYLDSPPLPRPPRFASVEEAEAWMEQSAPDIGVPYPDLPPRFESVEEADEWLRQKAGEPYVPPSWQEDAYDANRTPDWDWVDALTEQAQRATDSTNALNAMVQQIRAQDQAERDRQTQAAVDAYDELYSGDHAVMHDAAGPCEPGYHRAMPSGNQCRCGKVQRNIKGQTPTGVIYDEVYEFGREDPVMRIARNSIANADGTKPWEQQP